MTATISTIWNERMKHFVSVLCFGLLTACAPMPSELTHSQEKATPESVAKVRVPTDDLTSRPTTSKVEAAESPASAQGYVEELTRLVHDAKLVEMRTTYNGSYGASLFFWPAEMTYYVALFQGQHFWRVLKLQDEVRAEETYTNFAAETWELAEAEIQRAKLQAQESFLKRAIVLSNDQAKRLHTDLDIAREQQASVERQQQATQAEAVMLRSQTDTAQAQLRQIQQQIKQLEDQTEDGLSDSK